MGEDRPESSQASRPSHGGHGVLSCSGISITIVLPAGCNSLVAYFPPVGSPVGLIWPPVGLILKRAAVPGAAPPFQTCSWWEPSGSPGGQPGRRDGPAGAWTTSPGQHELRRVTQPTTGEAGSGQTSKSVLVTGSSSGIGLASVVAMSARGWEVFASMRDPSCSGSLMSALRDRPGRVHVLQLDLTDKRSITAAMAEVAERTGGRLDALVHNAGAPGAGFLSTGALTVYAKQWRPTFSGRLSSRPRRSRPFRRREAGSS